ncbi:MAG: nitrous oxide reductase family maturation protein NosD [Promethearchaeota archaeon]
MRQKTKIKIVLITLISFLIFLINARENFGYNLKTNRENFKYKYESVFSHSEHTTILPIEIDDLGDGNYIWDDAKDETWCSGSGTEDDPYIIQDLKIDGGDLGSCIKISNSKRHFIIQNCIVFNSKSKCAGIELKNTIKGKIINNICSGNNGEGILLNDSDDNLIEGNKIEENEDYGIILKDSDDNTIKENKARDNGEDGIVLRNSDNNLIEKNIFNENDYNGIAILESSENEILENEANENWHGIILEGSDNNIIEQNTANNNGQKGHRYGYGIYLWMSNNNFVSENTVNNNDEPIVESYGCFGNIIMNNKCKPYVDFWVIILIIIIINIIPLLFFLIISKRKKSKRALDISEREIKDSEEYPMILSDKKATGKFFIIIAGLFILVGILFQILNWIARITIIVMGITFFTLGIYCFKKEKNINLEIKSIDRFIKKNIIFNFLVGTIFILVGLFFLYDVLKTKLGFFYYIFPSYLIFKFTIAMNLLILGEFEIINGLLYLKSNYISIRLSLILLLILDGFLLAQTVQLFIDVYPYRNTEMVLLFPLIFLQIFVIIVLLVFFLFIYENKNKVKNFLQKKEFFSTRKCYNCGA